MTRPTLLLDCYLEDPGAAGNFLPSLEGREAQVVRPHRGALPIDPTAYGAIIVSGSAASVVHEPPDWIAPLEAFLAAAVDRAVPTLGVCFGHQILASALCGRDAVFMRPRMEIGWVDVDLDDDPLYVGFGGGLQSFVTHFDEVRPDLPGIAVTGRSGECPVQAIRVLGKPAWGVQFHPEMRMEEAVDVVRRKAALAPDHVPDPERIIATAPAIDDDRHVRRLIANFFAAIR